MMLHVQKYSLSSQTVCVFRKLNDMRFVYDTGIHIKFPLNVRVRNLRDTILTIINKHGIK